MLDKQSHFIFIPTYYYLNLPIRKLQFREVKELSYSYTARKQWSQVLNLRRPSPESYNAAFQHLTWPSMSEK